MTAGLIREVAVLGPEAGQDLGFPLVKRLDEGLALLRNGIRVLGLALGLSGEPRERHEHEHQGRQSQQTHSSSLHWSTLSDDRRFVVLSLTVRPARSAKPPSDAGRPRQRESSNPSLARRAARV